MKDQLNKSKVVNPVPEVVSSANEANSERVFSREEIMNLLSRYAHGGVVSRELSNEKGTYLLELTIEGPEEGERDIFTYRLIGNHTDKIRSPQTIIEVENYLDGDYDIPSTANTLAEYNSETKEWVYNPIDEVNDMYDKVRKFMGQEAFEALLQTGKPGKEKVAEMYKSMLEKNNDS